MHTFQLTTERLGLRAYKAEDLDAFAAMNADPLVMEYFPSTLDREESKALMDRMNQRLVDFGFTFWAAELLATQELIGFIGIVRSAMETDFTPCVEIGWRLASQFWGKGLATEGAKECLRFAFEDEGLPEIYSFTPNTNQPSYKLMQRLGMKPAGTFNHPYFAAEHRLNPHLLYHLSRQDWEQRKD
ncbi:MAG: GNAT family N-acetyltransferase [Bacteroidia bacterium]